MTVIVKVLGAANGSPTPHDDEYVVTWNPHTRFGICELTTTPDVDKARQFPNVSDAIEEWRTISNVEPRRPTDGRPSRPLAGLTIECQRVQQ